MHCDCGLFLNSGKGVPTRIDWSGLCRGLGRRAIQERHDEAPGDLTDDEAGAEHQDESDETFLLSAPDRKSRPGHLIFAVSCRRH